MPHLDHLESANGRKVNGIGSKGLSAIGDQSFDGER
jgi:hypothetical protein